MASRLQDVILRGLAADRPLATAVAPGTLYYASDTAVTERSDGTTWESYSDAGSGVAAPHAATHAAGGSDPVTLAESQVTGLVTDLAGKVDTTDPRLTDARAPTAHGVTHAAAGSDPVTVTALAGFPGGTATFLRADQTFAAPPDVDTGITQLTGDVAAGPGNGSQAATLATTGVTPGAYTNANVTVDAKGRLTAASNGTPGAPAAHAASHSNGGADPVTVTNLAGYPGGTTTFLRADGAFAAPPAAPDRVGAIQLVLDGGGAVLTTGLKGYLEVPIACTILAVTLLADVAGAIVVDIWKDTYTNAPPTVADSITASAKPTLAAAQQSRDAVLTGWTTAVAAGDILGFNVNSVATVTRVTLSLTIQAV